MKIGIITEYFPTSDILDIRGGAEASAFNEAKYLVEKHDVTVITSHEPGVNKKDNISGIKILRCGRKRPYSLSSSIIDRLFFIVEAYNIGKKEDFDIIVGYNFVTYPIAWKISRKLKKPCVIRYHDMWIGEWIKNFGLSGITGELIERYILSKNLDMILSVSNYTKNKLEKHFKPEKIIVIPNIVDVSPVKAQKYPKPTVCCVSRLVDYKRVDDLIRATAILKETIPNIQCKIIGTGPKENYLRKLTEELGVKENIQFCGFVEDHDDVLRTIKSSHVFCLPSIVEGFGIVIVESMALSVPFVASNITPLVEASGGEGGLFYKPKNYVDLADKVKYVLNNEKLRENLMKEGLIKSKEYKGERIIKQIESIYEELIT